MGIATSSMQFMAIYKEELWLCGANFPIQTILTSTLSVLYITELIPRISVNGTYNITKVKMIRSGAPCHSVHMHLSQVPTVLPEASNIL